MFVKPARDRFSCQADYLLAVVGYEIVTEGILPVSDTRGCVDTCCSCHGACTCGISVFCPESLGTRDSGATSFSATGESFHGNRDELDDGVGGTVPRDVGNGTSHVCVATACEEDLGPCERVGSFIGVNGDDIVCAAPLLSSSAIDVKQGGVDDGVAALQFESSACVADEVSVDSYTEELIEAGTELLKKRTYAEVVGAAPFESSAEHTEGVSYGVHLPGHVFKKTRRGSRGGRSRSRGSSSDGHDSLFSVDEVEEEWSSPPLDESGQNYCRVGGEADLHPGGFTYSAFVTTVETACAGHDDDVAIFRKMLDDFILGGAKPLDGPAIARGLQQLLNEGRIEAWQVAAFLGMPSEDWIGQV